MENRFLKWIFANGLFLALGIWGAKSESMLPWYGFVAVVCYASFTVFVTALVCWVNRDFADGIRKIGPSVSLPAGFAFDLLILYILFTRQDYWPLVVYGLQTILYPFIFLKGE